MLCNLCPRRCNAERNEIENIGGYCKMPLSPTLARAALHYWEEPPISAENGSGTVFFSGCSLGCVYCQNAQISQNNHGKTVTVERLAEIFKELEQMGAHNINLVTPTHYVYSILEALKIYNPNIPIVYNSSGYETVETLKMLEGIVDVYLLDFKYITDSRAEIFSSAADYPQICKKAIMEAYRQQNECFIEDGVMKKGVIIRHLLMPAATNEAISVFEWARENAPNAHFSLMAQYMPLGKANQFPQINRKITKREYEKIVNHIINSAFENCYIQELSSACKDYIPLFDLTGI